MKTKMFFLRLLQFFVQASLKAAELPEEQLVRV